MPWREIGFMMNAHRDWIKDVEEKEVGAPLTARVPHDVQGYLAHKKTPTPQDHHRALGMPKAL